MSFLPQPPCGWICHLAIAQLCRVNAGPFHLGLFSLKPLLTMGFAFFLPRRWKKYATGPSIISPGFHKADRSLDDPLPSRWTFLYLQFYGQSRVWAQCCAKNSCLARLTSRSFSVHQVVGHVGPFSWDRPMPTSRAFGGSFGAKCMNQTERWLGKPTVKAFETICGNVFGRMNAKVNGRNQLSVHSPNI